jgi:predicted RNA binding protein YcfA (HicA-like mRNA interferase family)
MIWPTAKARKVFAALRRAGWVVRNSHGGSHRTLVHPAFPPYTWAFRDDDEIGPRMLARIAKHTGLKPDDL